MNNRVERKYFNTEVKESFLNEYKKSFGPYSRVLEKSMKIEQELNKDLYDFSIDEIEHVLYDLNPDSYTASHSNARIVSSYIDWAMDHGYGKNTLNPIKIIPGKDWIKKFVGKKAEELFLTDKEIMNIEQGLNNPQDQVLVRLLFEGVFGRKFSEIINLKKQDINEDANELNLTNIDVNGNKTTRIHKVSTRCIELCKEALEVKEYYKRNNEMDTTEITNIREYTDLIDSDYVVRPSKTNSKYDYASDGVIYHRIKVMNEFYNIPTTKYIQRSGMLYMAWQFYSQADPVVQKIYDEHGYLEKYQYEAIQERFNFTNGFALKNLITVDLIRKIYEK